MTPETLKLLEENISSKLFDTGLAMIFGFDTKSKSSKSTSNKWDNIKLKASAQQRKLSTR